MGRYWSDVCLDLLDRQQQQAAGDLARVRVDEQPPGRRAGGLHQLLALPLRRPPKAVFVGLILFVSMICSITAITALGL